MSLTKARCCVTPPWSRRVEASREALRLRCVKVDLDPEAPPGVLRPLEIGGSDFSLDAETVILAVGQDPTLADWEGCLRVSQSLVVVDGDYMTSRRGLFAAGDVASAERFVSTAIGDGKRAATAIARYLDRQDAHSPAAGDGAPEVDFADINTFYFPHRERAERHKVPSPSRAADFREIKRGFAAEAGAGAGRALLQLRRLRGMRQLPLLLSRHGHRERLRLARALRGARPVLQRVRLLPGGMPPGSDGRQGGNQMSSERTRMLLSGNHAVSYAVKVARPNVIPVYPITPQTPILEKITDFQASGEMSAEVMTMESEHSAMAAAITASLTGVRVFTATASQGLLLMHEMLHYAAGARAPIVMANVNRTLGSPWGFWPDQTDSLAQRDVGWIQYYCENGQESHDTTLQAFRVAEQVLLPAMVIHEAFYVSHALEAVEVVPQQVVDQYLPPFDPPHRLDPAIGESWGNTVSQVMFQNHRRDMGEAMEQVVEVAERADRELRELVGRGYGIVERYQYADARFVIVTMGSMTGTARDAVDDLRAEGIPVGLLKIRLFRPFPSAAVRQALAGVAKAVVLDRNFAPGTGGVLFQELKAALYGMAGAPEMHGYLAGVGGTSISPAAIKEMLRGALAESPAVNSVWKG